MWATETRAEPSYPLDPEDKCDQYDEREDAEKDCHCIHALILARPA
jgi:hypothetical protein